MPLIFAIKAPFLHYILSKYNRRVKNKVLAEQVTVIQNKNKNNVITVSHHVTQMLEERLIVKIYCLRYINLYYFYVNCKVWNK